MARSLGAAVARSQMLRRLADVDAPVMLGRYRLERSCGRGSFGEVFVAFDETLERRVAIKVLSRGLRWPARVDATRTRLQQEARALAAVSHPHVVQIFSGGVDEDGVPYLVMELVEGVALHQWIARERPDAAALLEAGAQAAEGLAAVHRAQLVHGDIKPSNLLVGDDGAVRVADFGLTRLVQDTSESGDTAPTRTRVRGVAGTPAYVAPEVARGGAPSARSDQYALCRLLAEGLPASGAVRPPASVVRGLADDPADRHASAQALADALRASAADPGGSGRRWAGLATVATVATVVTVAGALAAGLATPPDPKPAPSEAASSDASATSPVPAAEDATVSALLDAATEVGAARQSHVAASLLAPLLGLGSDGVQARTHYAYGDLLLDLGRPLDALEHYRSSYFLYRAVGALGEEAKVSAQLVLLLAGQGDVDRAEHWVRFAEARVGELPEDDARRINWINALAQLALQKGDVAEGVRLLEGAVARADALEPTVAIAMRVNLAQLLVHVGRYDDAIRHGDRARTEATEAWGPRHALVGHGLLAQGQAEAQRTQTAPAAVEHLRAALDLVAASYGDGSPRVAEVHDQLGGALARAGDYEAAVGEHQAALAIQRKQFGDDSPPTATPLGNMAFALLELGRLDEAEQSFTDAITIIEDSYGDRYPALVHYWWGLADVRARRGLQESSAQARDQARRLAALLMPADHPVRREIESTQPGPL